MYGDITLSVSVLDVLCVCTFSTSTVKSQESSKLSLELTFLKQRNLDKPISMGLFLGLFSACKGKKGRKMHQKGERLPKSHSYVKLASEANVLFLHNRVKVTCTIYLVYWKTQHVRLVLVYLNAASKWSNISVKAFNMSKSWKPIHP